MSAANYDCHCFLPYPNYHHKKKNGKWKCVDDMECVRDYIPNKNWNCATHCIKKNRAERKGGDDMQDYKAIAKKMQDKSIVKAGYGEYVIYRRDWLYENIEQEYVLIKSAKEMKPIKDGIKRLREWMKKTKMQKICEAIILLLLIWGYVWIRMNEKK